MLDNETQKILSDSEELKLGIKWTFWSIVKGRIVTKITAMNDIMNIDILDKDLSVTLMVNQKVVTLLVEIIREIEWEARSFDDYNKAFQKEKKEEYLKILDE